MDWKNSVFIGVKNLVIAKLRDRLHQKYPTLQSLHTNFGVRKSNTSNSQLHKFLGFTKLQVNSNKDLKKDFQITVTLFVFTLVLSLNYVVVASWPYMIQKFCFMKFFERYNTAFFQPLAETHMRPSGHLYHQFKTDPAPKRH